MKKIILLTLLCGTLILGLTGCGMSKDNMLKDAKELDLEELVQDIENNVISAEEKYKEKIFKITATVDSIDKDEIPMTIIGMPMGAIKVSLSKNDIKNISKGQTIDIVGKIKNISEDKIEIKNAFLVNDKYTISGIVNIPARRHLVNFVDYTGAQPSRSYYEDYTNNEWFMDVGDYKVKKADKQNFYGEGDTILLDKKIENKYNFKL